MMLIFRQFFTIRKNWIILSQFHRTVEDQHTQRSNKALYHVKRSLWAEKKLWCPFIRCVYLRVCLMFLSTWTYINMIPCHLKFKSCDITSLWYNKPIKTMPQQKCAVIKAKQQNVRMCDLSFGGIFFFLPGSVFSLCLTFYNFKWSLFLFYNERKVSDIQQMF